MKARDLTDRVVVLLLAAALIVGGLALVDWQTGVVLDLKDELATGAALDVVEKSWFRWAEGGAGVVLVLLALVWLLAHLPRRGPSSTPLPGSDATGELAVDLGALGTVIADAFDDSGTVDHTKVAFRRRGGRTTATVTARLAADADATAVAETATAVQTDLDRALPDGAVHLQIQLGAPRKDRPVRSGRRATVRLQ